MSFLKEIMANTLLFSNSVSAENTEMVDVEIISGDGDDKVGFAGDNNKVDVGSDNDIVYVSGCENEIKGTQGDKLTSINGDNNSAIYKGDGTHETYILGNDNEYKAENGSSTGVIAGDSNNYKVGDGEEQYINIEGESNTIEVGNSDNTRSIKIIGDSNDIKAKDSTTTAIEIDGSENSVNIGNGITASKITGDENIVKGGNGESHYSEIKGNSNNINVAEGSTYIIVEGDTNTVKGGNGETHYAEIKGGENKLSVGDGETHVAEIKGNLNDVEFGKGQKSINLEGNENKVVSGDGEAYMTMRGNRNDIKFEDGNVVMGFVGDKNSVELGNGTNYIALYGDSNSIKAGNGDNCVESMDIANSRGYFEQFRADWEKDINEDTQKSTWSTTYISDIQQKKKTKSKCGGFKKRTTVTTTYTFTTETYEHSHYTYSFKGTTNTKLELGNGNNSTNITGPIYYTNDWDTLVDTQTMQHTTHKSKTSWNWSGGLTNLVGKSLLDPLGIGDNITYSLTGKRPVDSLTKEVAGVFSKDLKHDVELAQEGFNSSQGIRTIQSVGTVAVAVGAAIFTGGATLSALGFATAAEAGAGVLAGSGAAIGATAAAGAAGGAVAGAISTTGMAGANGQRVTGRDLAAGIVGGAVGGAVGAVTGVAAGAAAGSVLGSTGGVVAGAAAGGFSGAVAGNATSQLILNDGFDSREMWKTGAIGAGTAVLSAGITQGWNAGKAQFDVSRAQGEGFWSSLGDGITTGARTAFNTITGGLGDNLFTNFSDTAKSIDTINTENSKALAEQKLQQVNKKIENSGPVRGDDGRMELYAQKHALKSEIASYDAKLNADSNLAQANLDRIDNELKSLYDENGQPVLSAKEHSAAIDSINSQKEAWTNYYNDAQDGAIGWSSRYGVNSIDNNWLTSAAKATFNNTILETPMTVASNIAYGTGEALYNVGKGIYDLGAWGVEKTWNGITGLYNGAETLVKGTGNLFKSGADKVSEWWNSDSSSAKTELAKAEAEYNQDAVKSSSTSSATASDKSWLEKTLDLFKTDEQIAADARLAEAKSNYSKFNNKFNNELESFINGKSDDLPEYYRNDGYSSEYEKAVSELEAAQKAYDEAYSSDTWSKIKAVNDATLGKGYSLLHNDKLSLLKGVADLSNIRSIYDTGSEVLRFVSNNQLGAGPELEYTIGNVFSSENNYGLNALWKFSGAQSLVGAANDTWGYLTGEKFTNNTVFAGANAGKAVTNTIKGDFSALFGIETDAVTNIDTQKYDTFGKRLLKFGSNIGDRLSGIVNNPTSYVGKFLSFTPLKGTLNMIGSGLKLTFGNDYGWGSDYKYTLSGRSGISDVSGYDDGASLFSTIDDKGFGTGMKYLGDGVWDLSEAKSAYETLDKTLLYSSNKSVDLPNEGGLHWSDVNTSKVGTIGEDWGIVSDKVSTGWESTKTYLGDIKGKYWDSWSLTSSGSNVSDSVTTSATSNTTTNPIKASTLTDSFWNTDMGKQLQFSGTTQYANLSEYGTPEVVYSQLNSSNNWLSSGLKNVGSYTMSGLSAIGEGAAYVGGRIVQGVNFNTSSLPITSSKATISGILGTTGALTYNSAKIADDRKTDLSKLSVKFA